MKTRAEAVEYLRRHGLTHAKERDWWMGATIAIPGGTETVARGITVWSEILYLVPEGDS